MSSGIIYWQHATNQKKMPQKNIHQTTQLLSEYQNLVENKKIQDDAAQRQVLAALQTVLFTLKNRRAKKSILSFKLPKTTNAPKDSHNLYIWGDVGRGKSMLMDLFFAAAPTQNKRRVHFHAFMQEVHARVHEIRRKGLGDPVAFLAREIAKETALLCFDELQATDVADASLLYRLFEGLFSSGVCIVSTSNRPPESLYTGGVQAERFENFIALLKEKMTIASLNAQADYRYLQGKNAIKLYHYPLGTDADEFVSASLKRLGADAPATNENFVVHGRKSSFTAYKDGKIGLFSFAQLCEAALGAADYLALAKRLNAIIITDIPALAPEQRNEAKRFVTLIDTLYERKVQLICTSAVPPEKIYDLGDGSFEFHRTVSRITEMGSAGYFAEAK